MRLRPALLAAFLSVGLTAPARADLPSLANEDFIRMILTVMTVDMLKPMCSQAPVQTSVADWEKANGAAAIRAATRKVKEQQLAATKFDEAAVGIRAQMGDPQKACLNLTAIVTMKDTQFAQVESSLLQQINAEVGGAPSPAASQPSTAKVEAGPKRSPEMDKRVTELAAKIEGFGFDYMATVGIGGGMAMKVYPVVLFKNGEALEDIEGLGFSAGIDAHKRANPDDWTKWRQSGGRPQTMTKKGWENLPFTAIYDKLPAGFKLNGRYQSLGGGGNTALGGSDYIAVWSTFDFLADGRVVKGGGAGGYSAFQSASTAFSSVATDRRGRYRIDGLTLIVDYDNKTSERYLIVTDPKDPDVIWLDGSSYVLKD